MTDENAERWASVGRSLARAQLDQQAEATNLALRQAARAAQEGDLSADELQRCYETLEDAEYLLDQLADAVDGFDRPPRLAESLSQDQLKDAVE